MKGMRILMLSMGNYKNQNEFSNNMNELDIDNPNDYIYECDDILDCDEVYDDILATELKDNVPYSFTFIGAERSYSSVSNIPQIGLKYKVEIDANNYKEVTDNFLFFQNNKEYLKTTYKRLIQVAQNLGLTLTREDLRSITSIISACEQLIGRKAIVQQYRKGYFKRYLVFKAK